MVRRLGLRGGCVRALIRATVRIRLQVRIIGLVFRFGVGSG